MHENETFLTPGEIKRLTGRNYAPAQRKRLTLLGIPSVLDSDGKLIVLRAAMEAKMGIRPERKRAAEPDWKAMNAANPKP